MLRFFAIFVLAVIVGANGAVRGDQEVPPPTLPRPLMEGTADPDPPFPTPLGLSVADPLALRLTTPDTIPGTAPECCSRPPSPDDPEMLRVHPNYLPRVWGVFGLTMYLSGDKMAPNGLVYDPFGSIDFNLNVGLLPGKRLYIFTLGGFWAQKATLGVTNPTQGQLDFSKREMDLLGGIAWNYWNYFEARVYAYSLNNLNRGMELDKPYGYDDGVVVENRYYIPKSNLYDLPRLNFLSIGYYASKNLTGADGQYFVPGLFLRAYLTYEFVPRRYYVYADSEFLAQTVVTPKEFFFDDGFAARPIPMLEGLEFRLGVSNVLDVQVNNIRTLLYATIQVIF
jgi:hypothetical protein